jgi:hypothetical protein
VYLGDLKRLQDIQSKRDTTNRNWQRVILYNIAKSLHETTTNTQDDEDEDEESATTATTLHDDDDGDGDDDNNDNTTTKQQQGSDTDSGSGSGSGSTIDTSAQGGDSTAFPHDLVNRRFVYDTRQLWWKLHEKMQTPEYGNMLLLVRMKDELEERLFVNKQRHITFGNYEQIVNKLHVDTEGHVVEPFVEIAERQDRAERQRMYYESMSQDIEEEYATK